jgi:hypothetical protein
VSLVCINRAAVSLAGGSIGLMHLADRLIDVTARRPSEPQNTGWPGGVLPSRPLNHCVLLSRMAGEDGVQFAQPGCRRDCCRSWSKATPCSTGAQSKSRTTTLADSWCVHSLWCLCCQFHGPDVRSNDVAEASSSPMRAAVPCRACTASRRYLAVWGGRSDLGRDRVEALPIPADYARRAVRIELLYFDGCPGRARTPTPRSEHSRPRDAES